MDLTRVRIVKNRFTPKTRRPIRVQGSSETEVLNRILCPNCKQPALVAYDGQDTTASCCDYGFSAYPVVFEVIVYDE